MYYDFIMKQPTHFHNFPILVVTVLVANTSTTTSGHLFFFVVFFILFIFTRKLFCWLECRKKKGFVIEIFYFQKENKSIMTAIRLEHKRYNQNLFQYAGLWKGQKKHSIIF